MYLRTLRLNNFRNYDNLTLDFNRECNVIYGGNAQGKTNLIESIYLLSTLSLFKNEPIDQVIKHNEKESCVSGIVFTGGVDREYEVLVTSRESLYNEKKRVQKINNKIILNIRDYFGAFFSVAYTPSNMSLIEGVPSIRRKYFDRAFFYHKSSFIDLIRKYNKTVKERNCILKNYGNIKSLNVFTELLINEAIEYVNERQCFLKDFSNQLKNTYLKLLPPDLEVPEIRYRFCRQSLVGLLERGEIKELLESTLKAVAEHEKSRGKTMFGPHLDDFEFFLNGNPVKAFSSQGQKKSFLLALKLTEMELLKTREPVFFIDDFTSELDSERREWLLEYIHSKSNQSFITTTDIKYLSGQKNLSHSKYRVDNGRVIC